MYTFLCFGQIAQDTLFIISVINKQSIIMDSFTRIISFFVIHVLLCAVIVKNKRIIFKSKADLEIFSGRTQS